MAAHERGEEEEEEGKDKGRGLSRRNAYLGRNFLLCQELFNEANKTRKFFSSFSFFPFGSNVVRIENVVRPSVGE